MVGFSAVEKTLLMSIDLEGAKETKAEIKGLKTMTDALNKSLAKRGGFVNHPLLGAQAKATTKGIKSIDASIERVTKKTFPRFRAEFLSFLFFGMALKRTAQTIGKSTVSAFKKISEGASPAGQALTALGANFEFLKFTIGEAIGTALIPLIPLIADVVKWFAGIIQKNPFAVFASLATLFVVGSAFQATGAFFLFVEGMKTLAVEKNWDGISNLKTKLGKVGVLNIVKKGILLTVGAKFAIDAIEDAAKGDFVNAIVNGAISGGLGLIAFNKGKVGGIVLGVAIAAKFVVDKEFREDMINFFFGIGNVISSFIVASIKTMTVLLSASLGNFTQAVAALVRGDFFAAGKFLARAKEDITGKDINVGKTFVSEFRTSFQQGEGPIRKGIRDLFEELFEKEPAQEGAKQFSLPGERGEGSLLPPPLSFNAPVTFNIPNAVGPRDVLESIRSVARQTGAGDQ